MSEIEGELIRAPDVIGEVVGWRAWTVIAPHTLHPRLRSANAANTVGLENAIWPTNRWMTALCPRRGHEPKDVPAEGCSCGLYAAAGLDQLLTYGYAMFAEDGVTVIGQVGFARQGDPRLAGLEGATRPDRPPVRATQPARARPQAGPGVQRPVRARHLGGRRTSGFGVLAPFDR